MGNAPTAGFRGDDDVTLTAVINAMNEEEFAAFMQAAEDNGKLEASDYKDKAALIESLPSHKEADKKAIIENLSKGKGPFDD